MVDLSIVIVNWNTRDLLRACLASLRTALAGSPLHAEGIVIDNASADGSAAMVAAEFATAGIAELDFPNPQSAIRNPQFPPWLRLIANTENRNYAAGNNQGLREAEGEFVLLLNPDTEVPPGALEAMVVFLRERQQAGAVAPALVYPDGRVQPSVRGFPSPAALLGELTGLARLFPATPWGAYRARNLPEDTPSEVDQPMASAFLVRKAALEAIGLFDEQFPLFFNDVDLCFRLKQAGWSIWYDPRIRIVHVGGAATRQVRPEAVRRSHEGLRRFYRKHYRGRIPWPVYTMLMISISVMGWARAALAAARKGKG